MRHKIRADEDVVRLILMEDYDVGVKTLASRVKEEQGIGDARLDLASLMSLIKKYRGNRDHGIPPTHDVSTGERI